MSNLYKSVHDFFQKLNEHGVQYLLVGGFAVNAYGHARNTGDLDLWVNDTPTTAKHLAKPAPLRALPAANSSPTWTGHPA